MLTHGFSEFNNQRDTKTMYYLLVTQEVDDSLQLSNLAYEMTDMGGYDKPLEDFKKQYIKDKIQEAKEKLAEEKRVYNEWYKQAQKEEKENAKREGRPARKIEKKTFDKVTPPINEVDGSNFNYEWIPLKDVLHPYASGDTDACLRIYNKLIKMAENRPATMYLITEFYPQLTMTLAQMEANGIPFDIEYSKKIEKAYNDEAERLVEELRKFEVVKRLEAEKEELYQIGLQEFMKPKAERDEEIVKLRNKYKDPEDRKFNPNSGDDKSKVLFKYTGITLPYDKAYIKDAPMDDGVKEDEIEWYDYKTDKTALGYIVKNYPDHKEMAELLLEHSLVKTRSNGFIRKLRNMLDPNGRLHGGFNSEGTECVSGDTLLVTDKGIIEIQDLSNHRVEKSFEDINISVHSVNGVEKADGFYYNGIRESRVVKLVDGTELTTSKNHPLLKNDYLSQRKIYNKNNKVFQEYLKRTSWAEVESLQAGDYIALKIGTNLYGNKTELTYGAGEYAPTATSHTRFAMLPTHMSEELAEWLGMYMADGCVNRSNNSVSYSLTNDDEEVINRFIELSETVFNITPKVTRRPDRSPTVRLNSTHVGNWLTEVIGIKALSQNKDVPDSILRGTKEVQQAFLRGLTLDSSTEKKKYPCLVLSSVSKSLMDKVRVMLLNMGIYSRRYTAKAYKVNASDVYSLYITHQNLREFIDSVGFVESVKRNRVIEKLNGYPKKGREVGVIYSPDAVFVKIKEITEGVSELFDLHVPGSHSFVGNGVVNHNTSRLSSSMPNLQNMPRKTGDVTRFDYKYAIKRQFKTGFEGGAIIQLDYSGLEMRLLGLISGDRGLTQDFLDGKDTHIETAKIIYHTDDESKISDDMRSNGKQISFSIVYGKSQYSYANEQNIPIEEAEKQFELYFNSKPTVKDYIERTHRKVEQQGYVETMAGFRRSLRDVYSNNKQKSSEAYRQSVNTEIQGTGAFLTNMSLILINKILKRRGMRSKLIITVHDSIVLDCPKEEITAVVKICKHIMENLPVDWLFIDWNGERMRYPIVADVEIGVNYNDLVGYNEEDFLTFASVEGYAKYHGDLKHLKNVKNTGLITEEKYEAMVQMVESKKEQYQKIGQLV